MNEDLEREYLIEYMFKLEREEEEKRKFWKEQNRLPAVITVKIEKHEHNLEPSRATL